MALDQSNLPPRHPVSGRFTPKEPAGFGQRQLRNVPLEMLVVTAADPTQMYREQVASYLADVKAAMQ